MDQPTITQKMPYVQTLAPGKYAWCACGKSQKAPFCDGSHKGSGFLPTKLVCPETKLLKICGCNKSGNKPYCDGSHKSN